MDEGVKEESNVQISKHELLELYQLMYKENLFGLLSEENHKRGKEMLTALFGMDPGEMQSLGLRFSIDEHMSIASDVLDIHEKATDFWKIVTKIVYIMMAIEKNPLIGDEIEEIKNAVRDR